MHDNNSFWLFYIHTKVYVQNFRAKTLKFGLNYQAAGEINQR